MSVQDLIAMTERMVATKIGAVTPFSATVTSVSGGKVQIKRLGAASSDSQLYARLTGFSLAAGDEVVCINLLGSALVLGKTQRAPAAVVSVSAGLIGEIVVDGTQSDSSITASTTSTATFSDSISRSTTLPAGTWTCQPVLDARYQHSAGGNINVRIVVNGSASANTIALCSSVAPGSPVFKTTQISGIVSDGATAIIAKGQFNSNSAGTTTPTNPRLMLFYTRTA